MLELGSPATAETASSATPASPPSWHYDAACAQVGGDFWFPEAHSHIPPPVIDICAGCPARRSCLIFALSTDVLHGVWAALSPGEVWALRQRVLAGEPVTAVIRAGMRVGDARQRDSSSVYYRSAPSNPAAGEVARQAQTVTEKIIAAATDVADDAGEPTPTELAQAQQLLDSFTPAA